MLTNWLDKTFYPEFSDHWDEHILRTRILRYVTPSSRVLDVGAGRGSKPVLSLRGVCGRSVGVDIDAAVLKNPNVDEAFVIDRDELRLPFGDSSFDVVFSNSVIEHLADVGLFFAEIARVLRAGGVFLAKTPNRHHYVALAARLSPIWFHVFYNQLRGRAAQDTFPTHYACNTRHELERQCKQHGLVLRSLSLIEGRPEYLRICAPLYVAGIAYERIVNAFSILEAIRSVIIMEASKSG